MFNKLFFERDFPAILRAYCRDEKCDTPLMQFSVKDGSTYTVNRIVMLSPEWITFRYYDDRYGNEDDDHYPSVMMCPYGSITEIKLHPRKAEKAGGFRLSRK